MRQRKLYNDKYIFLPEKDMIFVSYIYLKQRNLINLSMCPSLGEVMIKLGSRNKYTIKTVWKTTYRPDSILLVPIKLEHTLSELFQFKIGALLTYENWVVNKARGISIQNK